jgi:hypothetical protein
MPGRRQQGQVDRAQGSEGALDLALPGGRGGSGLQAPCVQSPLTPATSYEGRSGPGTDWARVALRERKTPALPHIHTPYLHADSAGWELPLGWRVLQKRSKRKTVNSLLKSEEQIAGTQASPQHSPGGRGRGRGSKPTARNRRWSPAPGEEPGINETGESH